MWQQEKESHQRGLKEFSEKLQGIYNKPVYPVLGNHEGYPCDQFDVNNPESHGWILTNSAKAWEKWLPKEAQETYLKIGCYSIKHPGTKLRIVALNPFVQMSDNKYMWGNQTDPLGVLGWFENELKQSENRGEAVLVVGHIPPFGPPFNPHWSERMVALLDRYKNTVRGQMYGHVHEDYFALTKDRSGQAINVGYVNPSLSTYEYKHPSFRVYDMDATSYRLMDYVQYTLNLTTSNADKVPHWHESYRFTSYYGLPSLSVRSHVNLVNQMRVWARIVLTPG